jgi:serine/threonine protein phosphatase PrpC
MNKIKYFGDVLRKRDSKETKDKIEIIEGKKYFLFFLYDGTKNDVNSNRAVSAASKYIKNNFSYFQGKSGYKLQNLIIEANRKIVELNLPNATTGIFAMYVPKEEGVKSFFVVLGNSAVYAVSYNQFIRVDIKKNEKLLGVNKLKKENVSEVYIKNARASLFLCSDGFMGLLAQKRKDIVKILNQKDAGSSRASMNRIMKARNFDDLAYVFIKR